MTDQHLVSIVQKPAHEAQINAMLNYFQPRRLTLLIQSESGRIDRTTVENWQCINKFSGEIAFEDINFFEVDQNDLRARLERLQPISQVALPLYVGWPYWSNVRWLRSFATVVNLADGSTENTSIRDCYWRIKVKKHNPYQLLKAALLPWIIQYFYRADLCFYPFAPTYNSCFAKETLPASPNLLADDKKSELKKILDTAKPRYLIIGGFEHQAPELAKAFGINKYIATTKEKKLWVNGQQETLSQFLCAEEVLSVFKPEAVVGCASDAVVAAKLLYPDVPCYALESQGAITQWGTWYNEIYEKQTRKAGVIFVKNNQISSIQV